MAVHNFPSDLAWTVGGTASDPVAALNIGTHFALTAAADIKGVRFYSPVSQGSAAGQLWADGVKVAELTGQTMSTGWNTITFTSPYAGTTGVSYTASVLLTSGTAGYTAVNGMFRSGDTPIEVIVGPARSFSTSNGQYTYGTGIPATNGTDGTWFGVDAIIDDLVSPDGTVTSVRAIGSGAAGVPTVSASLNGSVAAVRAQGTGLAEPPAVDVITTVTGGGAASGNGLAIPPAVAATNPGQVTAVRAIGSGLAVAPGVATPVISVTATGTGLAVPPAVAGDAGATAVRGIGTGLARVPSVTGSAAISVTVTAVPATGSGTAPAPGVAMVETLPTNIGTGRVTARFGEAKVLVGDVDGIPNLYPYTTETVTFTSTAGVLLDTSASPAAVVILPKPIVCTLDSQGYLVDSAGHRWCDLIATDDADLSPSGRKWRVTFSSGLTINSFDMSVPAGTTIDLTAVIPT